MGELHLLLLESVLFKGSRFGSSTMAIGVMEFSREGYKIRKVFALESTYYPKEIFEF